jgi:hypothetical protein
MPSPLLVSGVGRSAAALCSTDGAVTYTISGQDGFISALNVINNSETLSPVDLHINMSMTLNLPSTLTTNVNVCIEVNGRLERLLCCHAGDQ